jgi:RNA polymerase sigma-70 factor, ECF subfamily
MARFQGGDEEAFQALFGHYSSRLINFAHRSLRSREEAEDVAQEALLRVYRKKDRYDPARPFRAWLFSIAVRLVSNRRRDSKRHPGLSLDGRPEEGTQGPPPELPDAPSGRPEQAVEKQRLVQAVQETLEALPENQRAAVLLARFEGMSYEEIAQALDISEASVKSLLFRARQTLKDSLASYAPLENAPKA